MKLRVKIWPVTWRYLLIAVIILAAAFGAFFSFFLKTNQDTGVLEFVEFGTSQIMIVTFVPLALITFYIISITTYYYEIEKHSFVMHRFFRTYEFDYKNIEFIDEDQSRRKNLIVFYSKTAKMKYLIADKEGKVLETLLKKCPEALTIEEFRRKHPEEKY